MSSWNSRWPQIWVRICWEKRNLNGYELQRNCLALLRNASLNFETLALSSSPHQQTDTRIHNKFSLSSSESTHGKHHQRHDAHHPRDAFDALNLGTEIKVWKRLTIKFVMVLASVTRPSRPKESKNLLRGEDEEGGQIWDVDIKRRTNLNSKYSRLLITGNRSILNVSKFPFCWQLFSRLIPQKPVSVSSREIISV